ncbi:MAG: 16S rRNA (guanine(527)-N(7))-methyltransferase RsmG [Candidatus Acidiferrales bacterium]
MTLIADSQIDAALLPYGLESSPALNDKIRIYIALLLKWNRSISLTTVTEIDQILRFHFGESLFALSLLPLEKGRLADVGSGAGFPGLALAAALPGLKTTLIESNGKKFAFLSEIIRELRLKNAVALRCRMEDVKGPDSHFDCITARALGQFDDLLRWARRQLAPGGVVALWLGEDDVQELSKEESWSWHDPVQIPNSDRRFILVGTPKR